jgi:hypothetical protein
MLMAVQAVQGLDDEYVATSAFDGTSWTAPARITGGSGSALAWVGGKSDRPQRNASWPAPDHAGRTSGDNATPAAAGESRKPIGGIGTRTFRPSSSLATRPADPCTLAAGAVGTDDRRGGRARLP